MLIIFITFLSLFAVLGLQFFIKSIIYEHISPKKIIIQTHNNENEIEYIIRNLKNTFPSSEIIIDDNKSTDNTLYIAQRLLK